MLTVPQHQYRPDAVTRWCRSSPHMSAVILPDMRQVRRSRAAGSPLVIFKQIDQNLH
jgi:hypothetical protein